MKPIAARVKRVVHEVQTYPEYFQKVKHGFKRFELRINDRDYQTNHFLKQREWNPNTGNYTGDQVIHRIGYILHGDGQFGLPEGYVIMQLEDDAFGPLNAEIKK